jgi:hypothetical protein
MRSGLHESSLDKAPTRHRRRRHDYVRRDASDGADFERTGRDTTLGSGDHCSLNLDTNVMVCANTERALPEAVQNLTGFTQLDATQQAAAKGAATTLTTYVIGAIYDGVSYGGASLNITTSGTCATGQYNYYDLGAIGWDDRISSFRSYAGCRTSLWENINETGAKYGPYGSLSAIGIMNNNASSIRWAA